MQTVQVDTAALDSFLVDWFSNPRWWFSATKDDDTYIRSKYASFLSHEIHLDEFIAMQHTQKLAWIIIYDQLPRHIYRDTHESTTQVKLFLARAIKLVNTICENDLLKNYTSDQVSFVLLPYRHSNDMKLVFTAMRIGWSILKTTPNDQCIKRFLKATYTRAPKDQAPLLNIQSPTYKTFLISDFEHIMDARCLTEKYAIPQTHNQKPACKIRDCVKRALHNDDSEIIISLSGGVDSIVLGYILSELHPKHLITAVHIDYANRHTSTDEAAFVGAWCGHLGIKYVFRRIDEINRNDCMQYGLRSTYESYTRCVRFGTYKAVSNKPIVFLGHNLDDSFENILTNITKMTKYENLTGWDVHTHQDGIRFVRPMLHIDKKDIYTFASTHKLPFLYDSTVKWSQRGKIRDVIVPTLNQWNAHVIPAFFNLAQNSTYMYTAMQSLVESFIDKTYGTTLRMCATSPILQNELFWRQYINRLMGVQISKASLKSFIERVSRYCTSPKNRQCTKIILSKLLFVTLELNGLFLTLVFVMNSV